MHRPGWQKEDGRWISVSILHFPSSIFRHQRGHALIEMGLTLPILLVLIIGTLDLGRAVYAQNIISNAAREGARYGTTPPIVLTDVEAKAASLITGLDMDEVSIVADQPGASTIRVTVTYTFTAVTPMVGNLIGENGTTTLTGISTMTVEGG